MPRRRRPLLRTRDIEPSRTPHRAALERADRRYLSDGVCRQQLYRRRRRPDATGHAVYPFAIACHAVSNLQFGDFVRATGYTTEAERYGWSFVFRGLRA